MDGYFYSVTVRCVGLDIFGRMFADREIVHMSCHLKDCVRVTIFNKNNNKYEPIGYLHHEDAAPILLVYEKYNPKNKDTFETLGVVKGIGNGKEVKIEFNFFDRSHHAEADEMKTDIKKLLDDLPGRIRNLDYFNF